MILGRDLTGIALKAMSFLYTELWIKSRYSSDKSDPKKNQSTTYVPASVPSRRFVGEID